MFANQVSIKDLFTVNSGFSSRQDGSGDDSSGQSNSQFHYSQSQSQLDFPDSQDMCGSQPSSQKDSAKSSPSRFYQRYMAKAPFHTGRETGQKTVTQQIKPSFQQQLAANKAKAVERDERDLLNKILTTIKDCFSEVKEVFSTVKDSVESDTSSTSANLATCFQMVEAALSKNKDEFLTAVHIRNENEQEIATLQEQVKERDKIIIGLKEEKAKLSEENQCRFLNQLGDLFSEHNIKLKHSMEQLYENNKCEMLKQISVCSNIKQQLLEQQEELMAKNSACLRTWENRIGEELDGNCRKLVEQGERLHENQQKGITQLQQQHLETVNQLLQKQITDCISTQMSELQERMIRTWKQLQANSTTQVDIQAIQDNIQSRFNKEVHELRRRFQAEAKTVMESNSALLASSKRPAHQTSCIEDVGIPQKSCMSPAMNVLEPMNFCQDGVPVLKGNSEPGFCNMFSSSTNTNQVFRSPITTLTKSWTSKVLFSKNSPATVATVRPQVQPDQSESLEAIGKTTKKKATKRKTRKKRTCTKKVRANVTHEIEETPAVAVFPGYSLRRRSNMENTPNQRQDLQIGVNQAPTLISNGNDWMPLTGASEHRQVYNQARTSRSNKNYLNVQSHNNGPYQRLESHPSNRFQESPLPGKDVFDFDDQRISPCTNYHVGRFMSQRNPRPSRQATSDARWELAKLIKPSENIPQRYSSTFQRSSQTETDEEDTTDGDSQISSPSLSVNEIILNRRVKKPETPICSSVVCSRSCTSLPANDGTVYTTTTTSNTLIENASYKVNLGKRKVNTNKNAPATRKKKRNGRSKKR